MNWSSATPGRPARLLAWLIAAAIGSLLLANVGSSQEQARGVLLTIDGAIGPATADYFVRSLDDAADSGARLVVLTMDTPGGLDSSMRDIIRAILGSPVPVASYVSPPGARAASAGTFILYASHVAAMAPGTNLGAATPVAIGGGFPGAPPEEPEPDGPDEAEPDGPAEPAPRDASEAKAINDAVAYIRSLADLRGRNAEWAERAVREAASLSSGAAAEQDVIDFVAQDLDDLLAQADGLSVTVGNAPLTLATQGMVLERVEPDWLTALLAVITDPNVALILMMIGIYGLLFEFMSPGAVVPGTVGAISLLLGLYALAILPIDYAGLGLILLGLGLMTAEAFAPSFGILGLGGAAAFALGAAILTNTRMPGFAVSWPVIAALIAVSLAFSLLVLRAALRARKRAVVTGREEMIGARAQVQDWHDRRGHVFLRGERWAAVADTPLAPGQPVRVRQLDGLTLEVEPIASLEGKGSGQ